MSYRIKHYYTSCLHNASLYAMRLSGVNIVKVLGLMLVAISMLSVTGCLKEDTPVVLPPHEGGAQVTTINIGNDYRREVYYDLETKDTSGEDYEAWDLAFDATTSGFHVWINGGFGIKAALTNQTNMLSVMDTTNCVWKYDNPAWDADSTAIGNWQTTGNRVYVIDRSLVSPGSTADRFWKIKIQNLTNSSYDLSYCRLTDTVIKTITINKSPNHNYSYFTFNNNGTAINVEPDITKWDLLFTRYRYIYYDFSPPLPYYVNGVLLNPHLTMAAVDSVTNYNSIDYNFAKSLTLSSKRDVIGYVWKYFNFTTALYEVKPYYVYIIKDQEGYYYKLHFLSFYDNQGHKGVPKFEYQRL